MQPPTKRLKISSERPKDAGNREQKGSFSMLHQSQAKDENSLKSLSRSITPPPRSRSRPSLLQTQRSSPPTREGANLPRKSQSRSSSLVSSPIKLTSIRDLPLSSGSNIDTIKLRDILGDPMIRECWQFNYLFDIDFLMSQFDDDVRTLVHVKVVHGSWKREAPNRVRIEDACSRYLNVEAITAYMPEPFGTHHSKMMILLRHDDFAQVVIHTANMIPGDWTNMCQAVWQSPLLPISPIPESLETGVSYALGSGKRFKRDLLAYLDAYGDKKIGSLIRQLKSYDFSSIRAALVASVPSKQMLGKIDSKKTTLWGWPSLKDTIQQVPLNKSKTLRDQPSVPHIVIQISSIASLGQTDNWLKKVLFDALCPSTTLSASTTCGTPRFSIIFPTPDEIRRSLNGYGSGGSIHMKLQSTAQQKQLQYLRPYLCHWAGDKSSPSSGILNTGDTAGQQYGDHSPKREAGRRRAAPHIKTYIRFSDTPGMDHIDWAMLTSANLSTQAWGAAINTQGEVRICSWEIGVIVWPGLFADGHDTDGNDVQKKPEDMVIEMIPCFKHDIPLSNPHLASGVVTSGHHVASSNRQTVEMIHGRGSTATTLVGFRMPYDLPLTAYSPGDVPWCATAQHPEPDWLGQTWDGD